MSSTLKRAAGPSLVAGLVVVSLATPAAAQTPGSTAFRIFGGLAGVQARSGVNNQVTATVSGGRLILSDTTGIAVGPGCTRVTGNPNSADCGSVLTVTRLAIALGDGDDTFDGSAVFINTTVDAGTGTDSVKTNGRNDLVGVQDNAGGDSVDCGGGTDTVFADPGDTNITNCEVRYNS
ncbi:hypothetical protein [Streptomyces cellostaticus]|uniref:hypothetical protein n=1 Tax=Streptomyces cellostaticus TaxID=67285 RepID=UPI00131ACE31|nr:hypothetical protein [Streptomyces cellostaticus]